MKLSHPQRNFIAARMALYLGFQIQQTQDEKKYFTRKRAKEDTKPLCNLCIELDDTLLESLRNIWKVRTNFEDFSWVFVDGRIHSALDDTVMDDSDLKIAQALSPSERTRVSKENGTEFYYYMEPFDVNKVKPTLFEGPTPRWDCGQEDTDSFVWTSKSSDGPIRLEIPYNVENITMGHIPMFRRSKQFCLDARQISEAELGKQVRIVLDEIVKYYNVPREIQYRILRYLPYREAFPYVQRLDLVAAHDREWIVERGPGPSLFLEKEISKLNDEFVSLGQVGLGPTLKVRLDTKEEDTVRQRRLALGEGVYQDSVDDWKMSGGLGGLVDCMLHDRVLVGAWGRDGDSGSGTDQVPAQWALGRNLRDQAHAEGATRDLHAYTGRCEWC
ncbi:hypothetical protein FLAG1_04067 [Fusarium langsethiae]|uniref:Uncharacterized protein n=1 Tax=Fusarium langsethiae TaxID=179993 RepID=A0A0N0V7B1_FUSLA|nr:hypothetical protein FLAG1_04067 [Fusarium langsethiae]GKU05321.1 unnamed protein product [Fusarium langsethiae]GKU18690.1 unnamed protein product [Fusarium langsethiae]